MASNLTELLERVKTATGAHRDLDACITCAVNGWQYVRRVDDAVLVYKDKTADPVWELAPPVTSSLDRALALVERTLPGWRWCIDERHLPSATLANFHGPGTANASAATPPLAVLAAILTALIAREESPHA